MTYSDFKIKEQTKMYNDYLAYNSRLSFQQFQELRGVK